MNNFGNTNFEKPISELVMFKMSPDFLSIFFYDPNNYKSPFAIFNIQSCRFF